MDTRSNMEKQSNKENCLEAMKSFKFYFLDSFSEEKVQKNIDNMTNKMKRRKIEISFHSFDYNVYVLFKGVDFAFVYNKHKEFISEDFFVEYDFKETCLRTIEVLDIKNKTINKTMCNALQEILTNVTRKTGFGSVSQKHGNIEVKEYMIGKSLCIVFSTSFGEFYIYNNKTNKMFDVEKMVDRKTTDNGLVEIPAITKKCKFKIKVTPLEFTYIGTN